MATEKKYTNQNLRDPFIIAGKDYNSRLIVGTGRYDNFEITRDAIKQSGAEIVTVALRRVNITKKDEPKLQDYVSPKDYTYLPNTAGCYTADDAVRTLRLAREAGGWNLVKLEVIGDQKTLYPDMVETLKAAKELVNDKFDVMVYCNDDPLIAKQLEEIGCIAIMPLAAPIGSGRGIQNPFNIKLIIEQAKVPVLVDAGIGTASEAAFAMELGCEGVIINTAIARAKDPVLMAESMKQAVISGRLAFRAGRIPIQEYATASTPNANKIN